VFERAVLSKIPTSELVFAFIRARARVREGPTAVEHAKYAPTGGADR
jgi:hypothetical protein